MSFWIDVDEITKVKIAESWYTVKEKSFDIDAYEFILGGDPLYSGEQQGCSSGCTFITVVDDKEVRLFAPMTSVMAVTASKKVN